MMKKTAIIVAMAALFAACSPVEYDSFSTLTGTVVDADDQSPISGASVSLSPTGKSAYTDGDGYFQFEELEARSYTIQVQKTGYQANRKTVAAHAGVTESVIIPMKKQQ